MQKRRNQRHQRKTAVRNDGVEGALIYIRVSTAEQGHKVLNLENQEKTIREFCDNRAWPIVEKFLDTHSARTAIDRPSLQKLISYCLANRSRVRYVVVYELSRFARNIEDQNAMRRLFKEHGILLRSVAEGHIDETATGQLMGNVLGSFNQHFSDSLSEKMAIKTRQSAASGRFPWKGSLGYTNIGSRAGKGASNLVVDDERAPFIRRAFELIHTDRFKQADVLEIINKEGLTTRKGKAVSMQTFQAILRNPIYAGWITMPSDETFEPVRGLHEPIISQELFDRVQEILEGRTPTATPKRKINPDFPLKCFVCCESCGKPLTGGFCKGKTKTYRRYWCYREGCRVVRLPADELEAEFVHLLESLLPAPGDDREMSRADRDAWVDQQGDVAKETRRLQTTLEELKGEKRKILKLLMDGRISDITYTESESEYSGSIRSAEQELRSLQSRGGDQEAFLKFADEFRSVNMATAWQMATPDQKERVQTFLFEGGLSYSQKTKSLNPSNSSLFSALEVLRGTESSLASPTGFEPVLSP
jgi:site-specific DNA recombinase